MKVHECSCTALPNSQVWLFHSIKVGEKYLCLYDSTRLLNLYSKLSAKVNTDELNHRHKDGLL